MEIVSWAPEYRDRVAAFLRKEYPSLPLKADEAYFRWRFQSNPLDGGQSAYYLALKDGEVVGQAAALADQLYIDSAWRRCVWLVDLRVEESKRAARAGLHLLQRVMTDHDLALTLSVCPNMVDIYSFLGWKRKTLAHTFLAPIRPSEMLRMAAEGGEKPLHPAVSLAARAADWALPPARRAALWFQGRGSSPIAFSKTVPPDVDSLAESAVPHLGVTTCRSAAFLDWKFDRRPVGEHFWAVARDPTGALLGYFAVKRMERGGARWTEIADYLVRPEDEGAFDALLTAVLGESLRRGAGFVRLRSSLPNHRRRLRPPFWLHSQRPLVEDVAIYSKETGLADRLLAERWHLTAIASDRVDYGGDEKAEPAAPTNAAEPAYSTSGEPGS